MEAKSTNDLELSPIFSQSERTWNLSSQCGSRCPKELPGFHQGLPDLSGVTDGDL